MQKKKKITFELDQKYADILKNYCRELGLKQGVQIENMVKQVLDTILADKVFLDVEKQEDKK